MKFFFVDIPISFTLAVFLADPRIVLLYFGLKAIGLFYLKYLIQGSDTKVLNIFNIVFLIFMSYLGITHFVNINDPLVDYFFHNDQIVFYEDALRIGSLEWSQIIDGSIFNLRYSEYPLFSLLIGLLYKFGNFINVTDLLLFFKMSVVLLASLIPAMIASISNLLNVKYKTSSFIIFSLFSYILIQSVIFTRDLHVAFFFTLLTYLILVPRTKNRVIKLLFLIIFITGLRIENGLFSFVFLLAHFICQYRVNKYFIYFTLLIAVLAAIYFGAYEFVTDIFVSTSDVMSHLTSINATNSNSLYLKLAAVPFPLDLIFKFCYTLLMPFPLYIWVAEDITLLLSIITPFYWIFILSISMSSFFVKQRTYNVLTLLFIACLLFLMLSSYVEPTVRRNFAMYPIIFLYYLSVKNNFSSKFIKANYYLCSVFIVSLNLLAFAYIVYK